MHNYVSFWVIVVKFVYIRVPRALLVAAADLFYQYQYRGKEEKVADWNHFAFPFGDVMSDQCGVLQFIESCKSHCVHIIANTGK